MSVHWPQRNKWRFYDDEEKEKRRCMCGVLTVLRASETIMYSQAPRFGTQGLIHLQVFSEQRLLPLPFVLSRSLTKMPRPVMTYSIAQHALYSPSPCLSHPSGRDDRPGPLPSSTVCQKTVDINCSCLYGTCQWEHRKNSQKHGKGFYFL